MNIEYIISRGTILVGVFTFGISIGHSLDFLFEYWNFLTAISTAGLFTIAFLAKEDYKKIKQHNTQSDLINSLIQEDIKQIITKSFISLQNIAIEFNELKNINIDSIDDNLVNTYSERIKEHFDIFTSNKESINRIEKRISLISKNEELKKIFRKILIKLGKVELHLHEFIIKTRIYKIDRSFLKEIKNLISEEIEYGETSNPYCLSNILVNNSLIDIHIKISNICDDFENQLNNLIQKQMNEN